MEAIHIPRIAKAPEQKEVIQIHESILDLQTLTPVKGRMIVKHRGNYLEVLGKAETIVTLTCHRCLQQYNYRLAIDTSEIIWLDESAEGPDTGPLERETPLEDLMETLPPDGYFHPDEWLYEQLCLAMPLRQLCDRDCLGVIPAGMDAIESTVDRRWQALEALKKQLSN
ncbi:MAG: DUF177 domain-containing protein [Cyanosarcina radialis HA8281-LM2]|jgi:uncharacterized protein|nr:DUF177 domain-containing protein [Cyanosarcina radialis HA8281-LM2]